MVLAWEASVLWLPTTGQVMASDITGRVLGTGLNSGAELKAVWEGEEEGKVQTCNVL